MNKIGETLKKLRKENGLTGKEAVEKLKKFGIDISAKTLYGYESGRNSTNADMFLALCQIYKCQNIMEVFSNSVDDVLFTNREWNIVEKYRFISENSADGASVIDTILDREYTIANRIHEQKLSKILIEASEKHSPIRYISYHQRLASAGNGQIVFEDMPVDRIEIPDIPKYKRVSYAIGVNGQSMEPLYNDGDILLIEPTCQIKAGEIGIFIVDGEAFVKKLGEGELISLNKGYPNITLTEHSNCMGRVVDKLHKS